MNAKNLPLIIIGTQSCGFQYIDKIPSTSEALISRYRVNCKINKPFSVLLVCKWFCLFVC